MSFRFEGADLEHFDPISIQKGILHQNSKNTFQGLSVINRPKKNCTLNLNLAKDVIVHKSKFVNRQPEIEPWFRIEVLFVFENTDPNPQIAALGPNQYVLFDVGHYGNSSMIIQAAFDEPVVSLERERRGLPSTLTTSGLILSDENILTLTDQLIAYLNASRARDLLNLRMTIAQSSTGASAMTAAALDELSEEFSRRVRRRPTIETVREFRIPQGPDTVIASFLTGIKGDPDQQAAVLSSMYNRSVGPLASPWNRLNEGYYKRDHVWIV